MGRHVTVSLGQPAGGSYWAERTPNNDVGTAHGLPSQLFPSDNWWNVPITSAPVDTNSTSILSQWNSATGMTMFPLFHGNQDIYSGVTGIPIITVSGNHPKVEFTNGGYWSESDHVPVPIPAAALTEQMWTENLTDPLTTLPTLDRHMCIYDVDNHVLYEIYQPYYNATQSPVEWPGLPGTYVQPGEYYCQALCRWDATTNTYRTNGWTSTDAAGLQVAPGLIRYDEVFGVGPIQHAFRCCVKWNRGEVPYSVWPATHYAPGARYFDNTDAFPPAGCRLRLKQSFDISGYDAHVQKIFTAMQDYGLIVADYGVTLNGIDVPGCFDFRWGEYQGAIRGPILYAFADVAYTDWEIIEFNWGAPEGFENIVL